MLLLSLSVLSAESQTAQPYIDQAEKLIRYSRDTENPADFAQAEVQANKALHLEPENFDAQRYRAMALLGEQDFPAALTIATKLNKRVPDDIRIWALLSEIHSSLGDYAEAERCAQWILDLRRNHPLGFIEAAQLREIFGDQEGASEFYSEAQRRTSQAEDRSWIMVQNARVELRLNNPKSAAALLDQAEKLFPSSQQVIALRAGLARTQKDYAQAAVLLEKHYRTAPTASHLYAYALALDRAGRHNEAQSAYQKFESNPTGAGALIVFYYVDQKKDLAKALTLATKQSAARHDVATLDAYAWALFRSGQLASAKTQMSKVLEVGTQEPAYLCHAAQIGIESKKDEAAPKDASAGGCEVAP